MTTKRYLSIVLGAIGFAILLYIDWRIAVGLFIALWGNNLQDEIKYGFEDV